MDKDKTEYNNSVDEYKKEISKYPLLTSEEEQELARRIKKGDMEAYKKLVESNLRLVLSIACKYVRYNYSLDDYIQEGNIGLMIAAKKFDPDSGNRFSTMATYWIKSYIHAYAMRGNNIAFSKGVGRTIRKYRKVKALLEQKLFRIPTVADMAKELGISIERATELENLSETPTSLDEKYNELDDKSLSIVDLLESNNQDIEDNILSIDLRNKLYEVMDDVGLGKREKDYIIKHYGLEGEAMPQTEIASAYSISRQAVNQMEKASLKKIKELEDRNYVKGKAKIKDYFVG